MRIVNCTKHDVTFANNGIAAILPKSGIVARVKMDPDVLCDIVKINGIDVPVYWTSSTGVVSGLPDPEQDTWYLVSLQVYNACPNRHDLIITHRSERNADNQITHCEAMARPCR